VGNRNRKLSNIIATIWISVEYFYGDVGPRYWVFDGDFMVEADLPLTYLGLPERLAKIDAALLWGKNKKTYFFRFDKQPIISNSFLMELTK